MYNVHYITASEFINDIFWKKQILYNLKNNDYFTQTHIKAVY